MSKLLSSPIFVQLGEVCQACLRFSGESHRMEVYVKGCFCPNCKTFLPSKKERGRRGLASVFRTGGFMLLLIATILYSTLAIQSELIWMDLFAGYIFYFLMVFQDVRLSLIR